MQPSFLAALIEEWPRLTDRPLALRRPRLMKASSRPGANLPLVFFLFDEGACQPAYVLKVNRNPEWPTGIREEYRNYSAIYARLAAGQLRVPQPIWCEPVGRHVVLCETYVRGHRLEDRFFSVRLGRWRRRAIERFLEKAMAWIGEFHLRTRVTSRVIDRQCLEENFRGPLRRFCERPDLSSSLREGLNRFGQTLDRLSARPWPITAVHGDFDHGNILIDGDEIGVVDWEDCRPGGDPLIDLAYLVFHLALVSDLRLDPGERLATFFHEGSWTEGLVRRVLQEYSRTNGLDPGLFFAALPRTVMQVLTHDYGPGRDPRSIQLRSLKLLEFALTLCARERRENAS